MNKTDALLIADKILALINSQPRTPSREEIAEIVYEEEMVAGAHERLGITRFAGQVVAVQWEQGPPAGFKEGIEGWCYDVFVGPDPRGRVTPGRDDIGGQ